MELQVRDKTYTPRFDIGFVKRLSETIQGTILGQDFGIELIDAKKGLESRNLTMLFDVLNAAIPELKNKDVEEGINKRAEQDGNLDGLFEEVLTEMGESAVLKSSLEAQEQKANEEKSPEMEAILKSLIK